MACESLQPAFVRLRLGLRAHFNHPNLPTPPHSPPIAPLKLHQSSAEEFLTAAVNENALQPFYPPPTIEALAKQLALPDALRRVDELAREWNLVPQMALDLVKMGLYDVVVLLDDSSRLAADQDSLDDLSLTLTKIATAASLGPFSSGMAIRFVNSDLQANAVSTPAQALQFLKGASKKFAGSNPLATSLQKKILRPLVLEPATSSPAHLEKPVLVLVIVASPPSAEPINILPLLLSQTSNILERKSRFGAGAVSLQFGVVGSDVKAEAALKAISEGRGTGAAGGHVGRVGVDVTWSYDREARDYKHRTGGMELTPELWLLKLLMAAIDKSYRED
ncbi:hypothetical protein BDY24DRAFT_102485 [Mrakia frigida]|uniref:uncharacterized protein n=1 Tax=Mrakia frigida TaxID=29902 RepID=UPI003FCC0740